MISAGSNPVSHTSYPNQFSIVAPPWQDISHGCSPAPPAAGLDRPNFRIYNDSMITITKEFELNHTYFSGSGCPGNPEDYLFFDIETTGLSAKRDMVYLIGCVYFRDGSWHMKQWFADSRDAEREILLHFFMFSSRFAVLVHFNGTTFDIPFLRERAARFQTPVSRSDQESLDIYRHIRPLKKLFGLEDCRQKTLERLLGTAREDPYDGGQLISFYWNYLAGHDESLLHFLLLHNEEDVRGLPCLLAFLSYEAFFSGPFSLESETLSGEGAGRLSISGRSRFVLPLPCRFSEDSCSVSCEGNRITLDLPVFRGSLKYFFRDYASYYYLPEEDRAIHKSVAAYVDKAHKKKATAKTCYQKREGIFIPVPQKAADGLPVFREDYKHKPVYVEYKQELWQDSCFLQALIRELSPF